MRFFIFLSMFICGLMIQNIFATFLECDFNYKTTGWSTEYACIATNLRTSLSDRNVTKVNGVHVRGKSHDDVTKLYVKKQSCAYLPLNLGSHFKNLKTLYITNSNVQHLFNGDLDGLTKLKIFDVSHNPVEQLGRDFFTNQSTIEMISFYDCHLKIIDPKSLDSLTNLQEAHFQMNVCLDYNADDKSLFDDLKAEIGDKCTKHRYDDRILEKVNELSSSVSSQDYLNQSPSEPTSSGNAYVIILCLSFIVNIVLLAGFVKLFLRERRLTESNNNDNFSETLL